MRSLFLLLATVSLAPSPVKAAPAEEVETEVSTGVLFYTDDPARKLASESEIAEDGLSFHADRDPRDVAGDNAEEEIRQGNVCLRQARSDLHKAVKKFRVRGLCREIYSEELASAVEKASRTKLHPDVFRCYAEVEARQKEGFVSIALVFRGQLATHSPVPRKFQRAGFPDEPVQWALPTHSISAGAEWGWKGALKDGACTFDSATLDKLAARARAERRQAGEWARCRGEETTARGKLARLQEQFRAYVPDEWMAKEEMGDLLKAPSEAGDSPAECREALAQVEDRASALKKISGQIADEHGVTALRDGATANRAPASVSAEEED